MGFPTCKFCGVLCRNLKSLCDHLLGMKHRKVMRRDSPNTVENLGRLQYFVDTYLETIPVLGLEYVEEMQPGVTYNCTLCNTELDWQQMLIHITNVAHTKAYITRHHGDLSKACNFHSKKKLFILVQSIEAKYGRKQVHIKGSNADAPEPPEKSDPTPKEHDKTDAVYAGPPQDSAQGSATAALQEGSKSSSSASKDFIHHCSLCGVSSPSFQALGMHVMSAQHRRRLHESLKDCKPESQAHYCSLCDVSCTSSATLRGHVMGKKHRVKMQLSFTPSEVIRLGHILDTYMREAPILGLEYIVEKSRLNTLYTYSCTLCKEKGNLWCIITHLLHMHHLYRYIMAHHRNMLQFDPKRLQKSVFINLLRGLAMDILDREWFKENRAPVVGDGKRREDSAHGKVGAPPSKCDKSNGNRREDLVSDRGDALPSRFDGGDDKWREDLVGERVDSPPSRGDKKWREDSAGKRGDVPLSRCDGGDRKWREDFAGERGDSPPSTQDRGDGKRIEDLVGVRSEAPPCRCDKGDDEQREDFAGKGDTVPPSKCDGGSSFHSKKRPLPYPEEGYNSCSYKTPLTPVIDNPPLTKRGRLEALPLTPHTSKDPHNDERHTMEQVPSAVQELQFHNNHRFFEYLANFKIGDSHDAILIQKIIQNCIGALKRFQELEAQMQIPALELEAPSAYTSKVDEEILVASAKPESPPLAPQTLLPKETSNPSSEIVPKNKLTDFFSRIKNMHESEVVGIFQKIAATNPEFQGMNIPAVIRHLKHTGRLNTP